MASSLNLGTFLLGELQTLSTEARRKHPEVKEAAERVIVVLRGIKGASTSAAISAELRKSDEVIRPFVLACKANSGSTAGSSTGTRMASIAVQCLQQLVSAQAVSSRSVGETLRTLRAASAMGTEIQVKVLQMVLPLITLYAHSVVGAELVEALHVCLDLQRSRDAVVSNTAAAILRQAVEEVFERVAQDDKAQLQIEEQKAEDNGAVEQQQHEKDAHFILQDLCMLASDSDPVFLQGAAGVDKCLVLELIESVLTNHSSVVARHQTMAQVLRERLAPFIVGFFADTASFTLAVRCTRVVLLFVKHLHVAMSPECEVFLGILARLISSDPLLPAFYRVLAIEVTRQLVEDHALVSQLFGQYDGNPDSDDCHVICDLFAAVSRVLSERAELRAVDANSGSPLAAALPESATQDSSSMLVSATCGMRVPMYKLLDKPEAPAVPPTYLFSQALATVAALADGLSSNVLPSVSISVGSEKVLKDTLVYDKGDKVSDAVLAAQVWPDLLPSYEFIVGVRLDDHMFMQALRSAGKLVCVWGALGLKGPRDTLLALLSDCARPEAASLTARNILCLHESLNCAKFLATVLRASWCPVLSTLQVVDDYLLHQTGASSSASALQMPAPLGGSAADLLAHDLQALLELVCGTGPDAYLWVIRALVMLGSGASGTPVPKEISDVCMEQAPSAVNDRPAFALTQLRALAVTGDGAGDALLMDSEAWRIITQHFLATATFAETPAPIRSQACSSLSDIILAGMDLIARSDSLDKKDEDFRLLVASGDAQRRVISPLAQLMTGDISGYDEPEKSKFRRLIEVRRVALDTLLKLLQAAGHSVKQAWNVVFDIVQSVFDVQDDDAAESVKQPGLLMRGVFPCVQLVCSDHLADLSPECLRRCIEVLRQFGSQRDDLNIALTAIGQTWALCDFFQVSGNIDEAAIDTVELASTKLCGNSSSGGGDDVSMVSDDAVQQAVHKWCTEELSEGAVRTRQVLWILLLQALAALGRDRRHEVRLGAIQTLFRALDAHGQSSFDTWLWDAVIWAVIRPLSSHALQERARIFSGSEPMPEDIDSNAQAVASRSGVCVEDPLRLLRKQWDETAATALLGAVKTWAENSQSQRSIWRIGRASQAWAGLWALVARFVVGTGSDALERAKVRTRESVAAAVGCAAVLAESACESEFQRLRIAWESWVLMTTQISDVPVSAPTDLNQDPEGGSAVVRQENLCALLELGTKIAGFLGQAKALSHSDSLRLLELGRRLLLFVDVPAASSGSSDAVALTKLQKQVLDSVTLVEQAEPALALRELALLAAAPYAIERHASRSEPGFDEEQSALQAVVGRALVAFSSQLARADHLQAAAVGPSSGRGMSLTLPTLRALGVAAIDRLGAALCSEAGDAPLLQLLLDGGWQDAVAAMGLHMVWPLTSVDSAGGSARGSEWFVRAVPPGMLRLRDDLGLCAEEKAVAVSGALAESWAAVGTALAQSLGMGIGIETAGDEGDAVLLSGSGGVQQIRMLDAVVEASLAYVAPRDLSEKVSPLDECPAETSEYWIQLVRVLERGAQTTSEPVVLEQCDADGPLATSDAWKRRLSLACFRWLFHMSASASANADAEAVDCSIPAWVARAAAPALVRQCRAALQSFVADKRLLGRRGPMPAVRVELLRSVLRDIAQMHCREGALLLLLADKRDSDDKNKTENSGFRTHAMAGKSALIFSLYDCLVDLISVSHETAVVGSVQECLRRVSVEIFG
ncbi:Endocytosis and vacuole integrity protein [Coemansia sp. IMI 203386]|nr:Endocytosis and vacuole integrity protein [Coemansia sp. IMI 203386]